MHAVNVTQIKARHLRLFHWDGIFGRSVTARADSFGVKIIWDAEYYLRHLRQVLVALYIDIE